MASGFLTRLPFSIMVAVIAAVALGAEFLGIELKLGIWSLVLLLVPAVLAAVYLSEYLKLPYDPPPARSRPAASATTTSLEDEEFVDPVEEADRLDRASPDAAGEASAPEGSGPAPAESAESPMDPQ